VHLKAPEPEFDFLDFDEAARLKSVLDCETDKSSRCESRSK